MPSFIPSIIEEKIDNLTRSIQFQVYFPSYSKVD